MPHSENTLIQSQNAHPIETAIVEMAKGIRTLNSTRMKRDTIITLLHDQTKVAKRNIKSILAALDDFELHHLKPTPAHIRKAVEEVAAGRERGGIRRRTI